MKTLKLTACPVATEAEVQRALISRLMARGYLVIRHNGGGFRNPDGSYFRAYTIQGVDAKDASRGYPDVVAFKAGRVRMFEVKRDHGKLSDGQKRFARQMRDVGGITVELVEGFEALDLLRL